MIDTKSDRSAIEAALADIDAGKLGAVDAGFVDFLKELLENAKAGKALPWWVRRILYASNLTTPVQSHGENQK